MGLRRRQERKARASQRVEASGFRRRHQGAKKIDPVHEFTNE